MLTLRYLKICFLLLAGLGSNAQALVKDIYIGGGSSNPTGFCRLDNQVFFVANDGVHGTELWVTDGTEAGTGMVKDINPGIGDGCLYYSPKGWRYPQIQALGRYIYFFANDGAHGFELWRSDGTDGGTVMVKDIMPGAASSSIDLVLLKLDTLLVFPANNSANGNELWRSNGVDTGTLMIKDLYPGFNSSNPQCFFVDSTVVYFSANNGTDGYGLCKSNGTPEGTVYLKDVAPGVTKIDSSPYVRYKGEIYFNGLTLNNGAELWKTDGSKEGTILVKDINQGSGSSEPCLFTVFKDELVFSANDGPEGYELWASDGTATGTHMVKDICPGHRGSHPVSLSVLDTSLYFVASDGEGRMQFWKSDLTDTGTRIFGDTALNGVRLVQPQVLYNSGGVIYLSSTNPDAGTELWQTNGTLQGTHMLREICGGPCSSNPGSFYAADSMIFFAAEDNLHGRELFQLGGAVNLIQEVTDLDRKDVYPDPLRREMFRFSRTGNDIAYIEVFDLRGTQLLRQDAQKPIPVSVASFAPGIYVLRAYDKNDRLVAFTRFVKQ
jgi:trimeric autotransporter adhesin